MKEWIAEHPIGAFFLLGIGMSFAFLFPAILFIPQDESFGQILSFLLARIGVYSPVLVGMFVARAIRPWRTRVSLSRRLAVFLPTWLIAVCIHTASLNMSVEPGTPLIILFIISLPAALLPAFVLSSAVSGSDGVREMLATLVRPTGKYVYYLLTVVTFPVIHIVGTVVTNILNGDAWFPRVGDVADITVTFLITFLSVLLFSGGINEESGWRGFAQKRMQVQYSPLVANLILWFFMVIWHIPNDIVQYRNGGYILVRIVLYPCITILFGWIYNRTKGSILAPALFHASMNAMNPIMEIFPMTPAVVVLLVSLAILVVFADRMWRKLPVDHPAVHQVVAPDSIAAPAVYRPA